jgi:putative ABC transport system substrate-binding protein
MTKLPRRIPMTRPPDFAGAVRRARILTAIIVLALVVPRAASADIVIVRSSDAVPYKEAESAVHDKLAGRSEPIRSVLVKELADEGIAGKIKSSDSVVAIGTPAARWLHAKLSADIRLVYCMVNNPADAGLLQGSASFGVTTDVAIGDQIKLIAEALPHARVLGMLYRSDTAGGKETLKAVTAALPADWRLEAIAVNESPSIGAAIETLTGKNIDAIWTCADSSLYDAASVRTLLLAGIRNKIPVWGFSTAFVRAGALIGVGVEPRAQGIQGAQILIELLDHPSSLTDRVQSPHDFQIALNLIVAQQLSVELPDELCRRAAFVFRPE